MKFKVNCKLRQDIVNLIDKQAAKLELYSPVKGETSKGSTYYQFVKLCIDFNYMSDLDFNSLNGSSTALSFFHKTIRFIVWEKVKIIIQEIKNKISKNA